MVVTRHTWERAQWAPATVYLGSEPAPARPTYDAERSPDVVATALVKYGDIVSSMVAQQLVTQVSGCGST